MSAHHTIDYIELAAPDLEAAKRFYAAAFGWALTDYGPEYAGFASGGEGADEDGGLNASATPAPGGPLVLLYSDDLDASLDRVQRAGGTVVQPPYGFPGGRRFHFADPAGNELGVWSRD